MTPKNHGRPWADDEPTLAFLIGSNKNIETIARKLGRTPRAVLKKARAMGMGYGMPQGFETFNAACIRTGFDGPPLKRVLAASSVILRKVRRDPKRRPHRKGEHGVRRLQMTFVDPQDVDDAIEAWHATETIEAASRRLGVRSRKLRQWLDGIEGVPPRPEKRHVWRVPTAIIEAVVASRKESGK